MLAYPGFPRVKRLADHSTSLNLEGCYASDKHDRHAAATIRCSERALVLRWIAASSACKIIGKR